MKLRYRIALIYTLLSIVMVLMVSLVDYYWILQNTSEDFFKRLELRTAIAAKNNSDDFKFNDHSYHLRNIPLDKLSQQKEYLVRDNPAEIEHTTRELSLGETFFVQARRETKARARHKSTYFAVQYVNRPAGSYFVIVSARNEATAAYLRNSLNVILVSIGIALLLSLVAGLIFSRLMLRTVGHINEKLKSITANQLHQRLHITGKYDELSELKETFNDMLDRLETTFETQKNFISNASHELNTPLTGIIGESEYILNKPRTPEQYQHSIQTILHDAERLQKIVSSLLHLAQTGYNGKIQEFKRSRIDEMVYTVKHIVDDRIPNNKVFINLELAPEDERKLVINANEPLLEIALTNIVMNACKYSDNQPVQVTLAAARSKVFIIIEDSGIGIPREEIAYIYEPFFRASNTGKFNGYGIGLPLARNIIRMHQGELEVSSEENVGTKIRISFPLAE
ncbi:MAG TPA: HAMP domain-containing sensor histidine kinase [Flavipsychrobacter sp.]|nr:HAMP domain-containing sensor histidine kinase [Flavipsychrobacter sp.]